jgi:hypothetical protein
MVAEEFALPFRGSNDDGNIQPLRRGNNALEGGHIRDIEMPNGNAVLLRISARG